MIQKFFDSYWFNSILAVLAAVLIIMQEVWIGSPFAFINSLVLGSAAAIGFSLSASVISFLAWGFKFNKKNILIGAIAGIVAALVTCIVLAL
jgi:hypothetical protein